jgi:Protein of unknown function (DUF2891)
MHETTLALTSDAASRFARLVLAALHREYPGKLDHVLDDQASLRSPKSLHPAFFGCFDWHSAVHGHWLLARLLRLFPDLSEGGPIRTALDASLTTANIAAEVVYLQRPGSGSLELACAGTAQARAWSEALGPLAQAFVRRYLEYLPRADYPIRTGVHANSAFGLAFAHDYALAGGHVPLRALAERKALEFFGSDEDYPAHLEPGGADFFSPALMEADLMRRVLPPAAFPAWFRRFLPGVGAEIGPQPPWLFRPAKVSDRADLQIVHLDGLNLSRAWNMRNLARALPPDDPARPVLTASADRHAAASLPHVCSGQYSGEHWLATFAVLALTA